jgi:uncharacterized delta-60 repeat protein
LAEALECRRLLNAGDLDGSFGNGGVVDVAITVPVASSADAVALAPDGKVVIAGSGQGAAARFNADGTLDTGFGGDGWADLPPAGRVATAVAVQGDGKVVLAGATPSLLWVARLNSDGSVDTSFGGGDGVFEYSSPDLQRVAALKILPDAKILAAGGDGMFWVARLDPAGALDTGYGFGGLSSANPTAGGDRAEALDVDPDGRVLVAGTESPGTGDSQRGAVARFGANGRPDTTFGGGDAVAEVTPAASTALAVHTLADGKVALGGTAPGALYVARLNADGTPDAGFAPGGAALVPDPSAPALPSAAFGSMGFDDAARLVAAGPAPDWTGSSNAVVVRRFTADGAPDATFADGGEARVVVGDAEPRATDLAVAPGGGIAVSARSNSGTPPLQTAAVVRLTPGGAPDASFGGDGVATAPGRAPASVGITRIAELPDGKYVAAGTLNDLLLVARYNRDGSLDTSFDSDGWATPTVPRLTSGPSSLEVLPDGKLLLGSGVSVSFNRTGGFVLARLNADGTPDLTFGDGGAVFTPIGGTSVITSIVVQPDGKIVAAGATGQRLVPPTQLTVARYNPNGSLDPTFGAGGIVLTDAGQLQGYYTAVALLADGSVLVGATVGGLVPNTISTWEFARYGPTGAPDLGFGNVFNRPGVMVYAPGDMGGTLVDLFVLPDGGFVAGGTAYFSGSPLTTLDFAVARFRPDGTPDPAFGGGDGVATAGFPPAYTNSQALGMDRQADGRIVIGGTTRTPDADNHFAAARFTADGMLDPTYGQAGRAVVPLGPVTAQTMILTSQGEALFSGWAPTPHQILVRLLGDTPARLTVSDRRVFYNDSAFDGSDPRTTPADPAAVAPDKQALRPGQTASFANVTSYTKGLNGVMIDLTGVPPAARLLPGDFVFRTSRGGAAPWVAAPQPNGVAPVAETGPAGSPAVRYALTWGEDAVRDGWLEVTVKANARTGLAAPDVFYFGNLVGDTGETPLRVDAADYLATRRATGRGPAAVDSPFDFDRDGRVGAADWTTARRNLGRTLDPVAPPPAPAAAGHAAPPPRRRGAWQRPLALV